MKVRVLSDLHLEGKQGYNNRFNEWSSYNGEDVLVLAGDIAVSGKQLAEALDYFISQGFEQIVYTAGNHEYYHHSRDEHTVLKEVCKARGIHFLDANEIIKIQDVSFFGGTLWTCFGYDPIATSTAMRYINDFRVVKDWTPAKAVQEFERQSQFIKHAYETTKGKKCIVTHFLPATECVAERYKSDNVEFILNKYFANDLGSWIETLEDTTWLFGHTHDSMDFMINNTRLVSNPLGYTREVIPEFAKFNPNKVIEL